MTRALRVPMTFRLRLIGGTILLLSAMACSTAGALADLDRDVSRIISSARPGDATEEAFGQLGDTLKDLVDNTKQVRMSEPNFKVFVNNFYESSGRIQRKKLSLPSTLLAQTSVKPTTVKGDPIVTLATGETFHYTGRAAFVALANNALPQIFLVDVRPDNRDYISGVWTRKLSGHWHHFSVPDSERLLEVPLNADDVRFEEGEPDASQLEAFRHARMFLAYEGGIVPGPSWSEAEAIMENDLGLIDRSNLPFEAAANVITYRAALARFRSSGFKETEDLKRTGATLLARFLEVARASRFDGDPATYYRVGTLNSSP